jgi:hypothetical protein
VSPSKAMGTAQQVRRTGGFELPCSADAAFPLFSPEGERVWVKGWDPRPIYPAAIVFAPDTVFRQGEGGEEAVWTILDADREMRRAEYVRVSGSHAAHLVVQVEPSGDERSRVTVSYAVTVFGENPGTVLDAFSDNAYAQRMRDWQHWICACLAAR